MRIAEVNAQQQIADDPAIQPGKLPGRYQFRRLTTQKGLTAHDRARARFSNGVNAYSKARARSPGFSSNRVRASSRTLCSTKTSYRVATVCVTEVKSRRPPVRA